MPLPLENIRVLDLTRAAAGPFCTMILGDLGADVVKVEAWPKGDFLRTTGPYDHEISVYFLSINRNKRGLGVDFRNEAGLAAVRRIAAQTDVVVENFKPGTAEAMGLGYDDIKATNPKVIYGSISGMGRTGPYGSWPGLDQIAQGMSGMMSVTGPSGWRADPLWRPDRRFHCRHVVRDCYHGGDRPAARHRRRPAGRDFAVGISGGPPQRAGPALSFQRRGAGPGRQRPSDNLSLWPLRGEGRALNAAALSDEHWQRLCKILGCEELLTEEKFRTNDLRRAHRGELRDLLNARFRTRTPSRGPGT